MLRIVSMNWSQFTRTARMDLGLSQSQLAHLSAVSLATIQNLEADRANPSLQTITAILGSLGYSLTVRCNGPDWDALSACGAPLMSGTAKPREHSRELLLQSLRAAAAALGKGALVDASPRELESLQALLLAVESQFPTFFKKHLGCSPSIRKLLPDTLSGKHIKLKRLAESRISEYL